MSVMALPELSDAALGREFVDKFGEDIRYIPERGEWMYFNGERWIAGGDGIVVRLSSQMASDLLFEASLVQVSDAASEAQRKHLTMKATAYSKSSRVRAMMDFAKADSRIIVSNLDVDSDPWLVGAPNGVIDLHTGKMMKHSRDKLIMRSLGCSIDPSAKCPTWMAFIEKVVPDQEVRGFLHRACGYTLTGLTIEHHMVFIVGDGENGKSTFLETVFSAMGGYAHKAAESLLCTSDKGPTPPHVLAEIFGVRFLVSSEMRAGAKLNETAIKDLTGGDTLRGEPKYQAGFDFTNSAKLWMAGNDKPVIRGTDWGIWRRVRIVEFPVRIDPSERDEFLKLKLQKEMPGILNWLVEGCLMWQKDGGLKAPPSVERAVADYRADQDVLAQFVSEMVETRPGATVKHADLFKAFTRWALATNSTNTITNRTMAKRLKAMGWKMRILGGGAATWENVSVMK